MDFLNKYALPIQGLMRIVAGLLFLEHGTNKMFHFPIAANAAARAYDIMSFPVGPAGVIEVVAGALITIGFFSRYAAFIASGEMAVAFWIAHFPRGGIFPLINGGGEAVLYCFLFLFFAAAGPGAFAVNQK
jgi:putative oxidoreductase